jgi:hypothetical protein
MTEAEFERRQSVGALSPAVASESTDAVPLPEPDSGARSSGGTRTRAVRSKPAKPKRVQRMFALEEDLDKKLWLYAIHVGKDRSEVVNDLLRPLVASMVLYDSRDRRAARAADPAIDRAADPEGDVA